MESNSSDSESSSSTSRISSSSQCTPSSSETDEPTRKKRRTAFERFEPRLDERSNIPRTTFLRWEAEGVLVPAGSSATHEEHSSNEDDHPGDGHEISDLGPSTDTHWSPRGGFFSEQGVGEDAESAQSESESDRSEVSDLVRSDCDSEEEDTTTKLFPGSPKTTQEAVLMLLQLYQRNNWTKASLEGSLQMVTTLLPQPNNMPKTKHMLFKFVEDVAPVNTPEIVYFYCAACLYFIGTEKKLCSVCGSKELHQFFGFSVEDQIKYLFEQRNLAELLDKYSGRACTQDSVISDISSGTAYKRVKVSGKYSLTLLWNTDGVSTPGKSSEGQFWPLQYMICELPYHLRKQFMIVCGVWFDVCKPPMNTFLKPFVESLRQISEQGGVSWTHPVTGQEHKSSVIAPVACADAPARADCQYLEHPTSAFGCNLCEQKRDQISREEAERTNSKVRSYFTYQEQPAQLRTNKSMNKDGLKAASNQKEGKQHFSVKGVKGPSVVSLIPFLDRATFVYPEYMHGVCLGVVLQITKILFFSLNSSEFWEEGINFSDLVDSFLLSVKPSDNIRSPRKISNVLQKKWRAHEYRAWLLFFSLPAFSQHLKHKYAQHWMLFVISVYLLLKEKITKDDLDTAESLLTLFVKDIRKLYGTCHYTYNVHQLLHLRLIVERWGPLWATSAFPFEDSNRILTNLIHGPNKKAKELIINLKICQAIHVLRIQAKEKKEQGRKQMCKLLNEVKPNPQVQQFLLDAANSITEAKFFLRANVGNVLFTSKLYSREEKKNNYTVVFDSLEGKTYGEVECFVMDVQNKDLFAIVSTFKVNHTKIFYHEISRTKVSHILPVELSGNIIPIKIDQIREKLVRVGDYVCHLPNAFEKNL